MAYDQFSEYYDRLTDNVEYGKRADYFCSLLSSLGVEGGIMLDLACGTGSMLTEMAGRGFEVIGVDSSVGMLNRAREKAAESGCEALLLCQPMQELDLYGTVDCCISVLDSINHLPCAGDVKETFRRVSLFTAPGGAFVFDVNTLHKHRDVLADNAFIYDLDDVFCAWQNACDPDDGSVQIMLDFFAEGEDGLWERFYEQFEERAYPLEQIKAWLTEAGFEVKGIYNDMTYDPADEGCERAVFAAVKK